MPAIFILALSLALSGIYEEKIGVPIAVAGRVEDGGELAGLVMENFRAGEQFRWIEPEDGEDPREMLRRGRVKAILMIPDGFSEALQEYVDEEGYEHFGEEKIVWDVDPALDASYRRLFEAALNLAVLETILEALAEEGTDEEIPGKEGRVFLTQAPRSPGSPVLPTPLQQTVPGWSLFAMFFIAVPLSFGMIRERADETMRRLLTYRISRAAILLGKLLPYFAVNILQFGAMLLVGLYVVPLFGDLSLSLGPSPGHLIPVTLVASLAATGFGVLIASFTRTAEQAGVVGPTSIIILAVAGGLMVPHFVMPAMMQRLALASPLYWAHQAYLDVFLRGADPAVIAPKLAVLALFAVACFLAAAFRLRID
jgi:ABC-2 type transport system permease protein